MNTPVSSSRQRRIVTGISFMALIFALHHVAMTGLYVFPTNPLTRHYVRYVQHYMEPLFEQRWQLFAPSPAIFSTKFWYRCGSAQIQTPWLDPEERLLQGHQTWRFSSWGKRLYVYQGLARSYLTTYLDLAREYCDDAPPDACMQHILPELEKSPAFQQAKRLAIHECHKHERQLGNEPIQWVQFQGVHIYPRQFSERHRKINVGKIEYLPSPQFPL